MGLMIPCLDIVSLFTSFFLHFLQSDIQTDADSLPFLIFIIFCVCVKALLELLYLKWIVR